MDAAPIPRSNGTRSAATTPLGHLAFFAEYLKVSGRFDDRWWLSCPLHYTSRGAPSAGRAGSGDAVVLSRGTGATRTGRALRGDGVRCRRCWACRQASLRARTPFVAAWNGSTRQDGASMVARPSRFIDHGSALAGASLAVLDCEHHDQSRFTAARRGRWSSYNPTEAGPSLARLPCVPDGGHAPCAGDVDVAPGNRHNSKNAAPARCGPCLSASSRENWPRLVRGDKDWGSPRATWRRASRAGCSTICSS